MRQPLNWQGNSRKLRLILVQNWQQTDGGRRADGVSSHMWLSEKLGRVLKLSNTMRNAQAYVHKTAATYCTVLTGFADFFVVVFSFSLSLVFLTCYDVVRTCPAWACWTLPGSTGSAAEAPHTRISTAGRDETTAPPTIQTVRRGILGRRVYLSWFYSTSTCIFNSWVVTADQKWSLAVVQAMNLQVIYGLRDAPVVTLQSGLTLLQRDAVYCSLDLSIIPWT